MEFVVVFNRKKVPSSENYTMVVVTSDLIH